jgi:hypothetical protein
MVTERLQLRLQPATVGTKGQSVMGAEQRALVVDLSLLPLALPSMKLLLLLLLVVVGMLDQSRSYRC